MGRAPHGTINFFTVVPSEMFSSKYVDMIYEMRDQKHLETRIRCSGNCRFLAGSLALLVAWACASSVAAQPRNPDRRGPRLPAGFVAHRDLVYARHGDTPLRLDVYAPAKPASPRPLIVWVHGGAWRAGSKDGCPALRFLPQGFVVASINYRLSQQAIFPAQIHDCKAAIRWLRAHAAEYGIDARRIGVWGSSAGGHLVALLGTTGDVAELEGPGAGDAPSSRVQAVCDFYGPTDFLQMDAHALDRAPFQHDAADSPESKLIGGPIQQQRDKVARANPITYVTPDDPPFLVVHGDQDPLVPLHQSQLLVEALQKAGVAVQFHVVRGAGHGFGRNAEVQRLVDEFFRRQLQGAGGPDAQR